MYSEDIPHTWAEVSNNPIVFCNRDEFAVFKENVFNTFVINTNNNSYSVKGT